MNMNNSEQKSVEELQSFRNEIVLFFPWSEATWIIYSSNYRLVSIFRSSIYRTESAYLIQNYTEYDRYEQHLYSTILWRSRRIVL